MDPDREQRENEVGEPLRELTLGQSRPELQPPLAASQPFAGETEAETELSEIAARASARCDALRWQIESERRKREQSEGLEVNEPSGAGLVEWASGIVDGFYWSRAESSAETTSLSDLDDLAGAYETLAASAGLAADGRSQPKLPQRVLELLCEAQSALRNALIRIGAQPDPDQVAVFEWVRESASRQRIYLKRHMRADNLAEPADWPELYARIEKAAGTDTRSKRQREAIEALKARVLDRQGGNAGEPADQAVVSAIQQVLEAGTPPSNLELREILLPIVDELPAVDLVPEGVASVLGALDRYLATRDRTVASPTQSISPELEQAARLLAGRGAVLIGGERRPGPQRVLESALKLKELIWIGTRAHQSIRGFEAAIARPEVALVLLAIRWSSHAFGDVKDFCEAHGKPLVRLPGGYNPNQVAAQIMAQASGHLEARSDTINPSGTRPADLDVEAFEG